MTSEFPSAAGDPALDQKGDLKRKSTLITVVVSSLIMLPRQFHRIAFAQGCFRSSQLQPLQKRTFSAGRILRQDPKDIKAVSSNYKQPPVPKPRGRNDQLPVYPLIAIFILGSVAFVQIAKSRAGQGQGKSHLIVPPRDDTARDHKTIRES